MSEARWGAVELGGSKVLCAIGADRAGERPAQAPAGAPSASAQTALVGGALAEADLAWRADPAATVPDRAIASAVTCEARIETTTPAQTLAEVVAFFAPYQAQLRAVGVASFGPLELRPEAPEFGSLLRTPKPGWSSIPVASHLRGALGVPVGIDTDVNAAALAERRLGAGYGADPCVYVTVGTGIGVGVSIRGAPLHGLLHPELGHLPAPALCDFQGACPFHGRCLEGVASASALRGRTGRSPEELSDDDPVWQLEARYLGHLLAACVLAYAPARIVLGGGVLARAGLLERARSELVATLADYVPRRELTGAGVSEYVLRPGFGQRAGLIGAFLLAEAAAGA